MGAEGAFLPQSFIRILVPLQVCSRTLPDTPFLGRSGMSGGHHPCDTPAGCATRGLKPAPRKAKGLDQCARQGLWLLVPGNRLASATCGEFGRGGAASRAEPLLDLCHFGHRSHLRSNCERGTLHGQQTPRLMTPCQRPVYMPKNRLWCRPIHIPQGGGQYSGQGGAMGVVRLPRIPSPGTCPPHGLTRQQHTGPLTAGAERYPASRQALRPAGGQGVDKA